MRVVDENRNTSFGPGKKKGILDSDEEEEYYQQQHNAPADAMSGIVFV